MMTRRKEVVAAPGIVVWSLGWIGGGGAAWILAGSVWRGGALLACSLLGTAALVVSHRKRVRS